MPTITDFYPRSPCGERRPAQHQALRKSWISIHALLAESDYHQKWLLHTFFHFYPRSPCGERLKELTYKDFEDYISIHALLAESDLPQRSDIAFYYRFLSTLSLRRATPRSVTIPDPVRYFYPRSPCGERPVSLMVLEVPLVISIHALLAESDLNGAEYLSAVDISIHALLAESDQRLWHFSAITSIFLSTLSLRRATNPQFTADQIQIISIHALLAESDIFHRYCYAASTRFLSTLSLRRATNADIISKANEAFLSTLSLRRATGCTGIVITVLSISIHALLAESDLSVE